MKRSAGWVPCVNRPKCALSLWNYVPSPRFDKLSAHIATRSASDRAQAQETARHRRR